MKYDLQTFLKQYFNTWLTIFLVCMIFIKYIPWNFTCFEPLLVTLRDAVYLPTCNATSCISFTFFLTKHSCLLSNSKDLETSNFWSHFRILVSNQKQQSSKNFHNYVKVTKESILCDVVHCKHTQTHSITLQNPAPNPID